MSASLSRGTGRNIRPPADIALEPDDEWIKSCRSKIEQELAPQVRAEEEKRDRRLAEIQPEDDEARERIEREFEDMKATYITIASMQFKDRMETERLRRRGRQPAEGDSMVEEQRNMLAEAQRSLARPEEPSTSNGSSRRGTRPVNPDEDGYSPLRDFSDYSSRPGTDTRPGFYRQSVDSDTGSSPSTSLPRRIPPSRVETADTFDVEHDDSESGSLGAHIGVTRKQSSGSMNSLRSRHGPPYWHSNGLQASPKDAPGGSRAYEYLPSPSTSFPAKRDNIPNGRSGITAAFAQSPPPPPPPPPPIAHQPARRDSNASLASSRSGGPGSLPRTASGMRRRDSDPRAFAPRTPVSPQAGPAVPVYTPPAPIVYSSRKKESTASEYYAALSSSVPRSQSPVQLPVSGSPDTHANNDSVDDEPLLQPPGAADDSTGRSWNASARMHRVVRHRPSSNDFTNRRLDQRPQSSASRPSPIAVPSSPESYRAPPSSFSANNTRRVDDDQIDGIPIPGPSERSLTAPQASPEWSRPFPSRSVMRRKTSFTVDGPMRNASISPESARVPYGSNFGRRNSVSSHHSGRSNRSYTSYPDGYRNGNEEWSPMPPYPEQSHDGSAASDGSDVDDDGDDFDEEQYFEELRLREEETVRKEEELRKKEEEMMQKEEEAKRKEEEMKQKEAETLRKEKEMRLKELDALRKEDEVRRKEAEAKRKEEAVKRKEDEAKRKEEDAKRKEEELKRKEDEARQKEILARRKEEDARRKEEDARRKEQEARLKEEEARQREEEAERREEEALLREKEAIRKEEQVRQLEEEARRKIDEEMRRREEALRAKEEEFEKLEAEARQMSDDARRRALDLQTKQNEAIRREEEAILMEEDARRREEDARRREEDARRKEEDARRKEDDARRREEYARIRAEEAKQRADEARQRADEARARAEDARIREELLRQREDEFQSKEAELRRREEELERREAESKRLEEEKRESDFLAEFARQEQRKIEELMAEQRRIADELAIQREARAKAEELAARLQEEEHQRMLYLAQQEEVTRAELLAQQEERKRADALAEERRRAQAQAIEERRRAEQHAEERRRAEVRAEEERVEASRLAEERKKVEALAQEERRRAELVQQEERRRQQEYARLLDEQRQEEIRRRTESQRRQDPLGPERTGTPYSSASASAHPGSRHNSAGSTASDRSSTASNSSWGTNSSWTSWASQGAQSSSTYTNAKAVPPRRTTSSGSYTPTEPSTPRRTDDDYAKWQERQEEQARKQAEQFRREQERLEKLRQAKAGQMLTREAVLQLFDDHDRQWARLPTSESLSWRDFPWPMLKKPLEPEELTSTAIAGYVLNPYSPSDKPEKDRIKEHIRRWHPDRFETKLLPKVRTDEREKVKEGAGQVVRCLNELLTRSA